MKISGRLSETTLGDVLGSLLRGRVTGLVRLTETKGATGGRTHGIYLSRGEVIAVDTAAPVTALGEILRQRGLLDASSHRRLCLRILAAKDRKVGELLVDEWRISPAVVGAALRQQLRARLDALFRIEEAQVSFHVACLPPAGPLPLAPREYLHGRPRARDRGPCPAFRRDGSGRRSQVATKRTEALSLLGLDEDASLADVTRAFREIASQLHPDRHPRASEPERRATEIRFAALSAAYHALID